MENIFCLIVSIVLAIILIKSGLDDAVSKILLVLDIILILIIIAAIAL